MTHGTKADPGSFARRRRRLAFRAAFLAVAGTLLLAEALFSVSWKEPLSSLYAAYAQHRLTGQFERLEQEFRAGAPLEPDDDDGAPARHVSPGGEALRLRRLVRGSGKALGRIEAARADVDSIFVSTTERYALRQGPGHYPSSSLPGESGKVAIAAHRTTWGAPFRDLDRLSPGDEITVQMPYGSFHYVVTSTREISKFDGSVLVAHASPELVLTTCEPLGSGRRLAVIAKLSAIGPLPAALRHAEGSLSRGPTHGASSLD